VLDRLDLLLGERRFIAGDDFTIAGIVHFGWLWRREFPGMTLDGRPNLVRRFDAVAVRPAVRQQEATETGPTRRRPAPARYRR